MQRRQHGSQQLVLTHRQVALLTAGARQSLHQQLGLTLIPLIRHMAHPPFAKIAQQGANKWREQKQSGLWRQLGRQLVTDVDGGVVEGLLVVGGMVEISRYPDQVVGRGHQSLIPQLYLHDPQADHIELAPGVGVQHGRAVGQHLLVTEIERIGSGQNDIYRLKVVSGHQRPLSARERSRRDATPCWLGLRHRPKAAISCGQTQSI